MVDDRQHQAELVRRARSGDNRAFRLLVNIHKEKAVRISYSITGNLADAQDLAQEAFIRAYRGLASFREKAGFSTWFYRILVNLGRDFLRKKSRSREFLLDEPDEMNKRIDPSGKSPATIMQNSELEKAVENALKLLPDKQQLVFLLRHREGLRLEEIARIAGISVSTAKVHLFRSVHRLRKLLKEVLSRPNKAEGQ